jgi:hypothetical protein
LEQPQIRQKIPAIIEIVDTHAPEQNVIKYCQENLTALIIIKLDSLDDLENIEDKIKKPTNVFLSNNMLCPLFKQRVFLYNRRSSIQNNCISVNSRSLKIDQIESEHERKRKQYYAIKSYYKRGCSKTSVFGTASLDLTEKPGF